ncbi:hypothetical protein TWF718_009739 [Orbilia javanica]|uniref:F-box domain-containing protein n=1 Tax=Orbilia javanica TaxID=47235 RepID=A0AAN8MTX8_9PEZI
MASLVGLSQAPETLYLILRYLGYHDIYSLLQTSKSLYPICHLELWSALVFDHSNAGTNPDRIIEPETGYLRFRDAIFAIGTSGNGFQHTKLLALGTSMFEFGLHDFGLGKSLIELLENGKLAPRAAHLHFDGLDVIGDVGNEVTHILLGLKNYSKAKTPGEFCIALHMEIASVFRPMLHLFDVEKITKYEVSLYISCPSRLVNQTGNPFRMRYQPADDIGGHHHMVELTKALGPMVNLKHFCWDINMSHASRKKFQITDFAAELKELQDVFSRMQKLESLVLLD